MQGQAWDSYVRITPAPQAVQPQAQPQALRYVPGEGGFPVGGCMATHAAERFAQNLAGNATGAGRSVQQILSTWNQPQALQPQAPQVAGASSSPLGWSQQQPQVQPGLAAALAAQAGVLGSMYGASATGDVL